jgi:hypothetical protein
MKTVHLVSLQALKGFAMLLILLASPAALAHKPSDSYLSLQVTETAIRGQWDIALRDLDYALGLDDNQDGAITWGELRAHHADIAAYALARLTLSADGEACTTAVLEHLVDDHSDGAYAVLRFSASCQAADAMCSVPAIGCSSMSTRSTAGCCASNTPARHAPRSSARRPVQRFELGENDHLRQFIDYIAHGVWHIWIGFDHLLFLLSLLLPAVLIRVDGGWTGAARFQGRALGCRQGGHRVHPRALDHPDRWPRWTSSSCRRAGSSRRSPHRSSSPRSTTWS